MRYRPINYLIIYTMRKLFFIVIISILSFVSLYCQSERGKTLNVISTAGSSIESESLVISWTVGDNIIDFLQIQESIGPKPEDRPGVMKMNDGTLLKVYPTLTKGPLTIKIRKITEGGLTAEFLDMEGKQT